MLRRAFLMTVHAQHQDEYVRRHQPIWPELEQELLSRGVSTYSIFLDQGSSQLFAYVEFADEEQWREVATTEVCQRWWSHMAPLMPSHPDNSPVALELTEVFHIEASPGS